MNSDGNEKSSEKDFEFLNRELSQYEGREIYKDMIIQLPTRLSMGEIANSFFLQPEDIHLLTSGCRKRYLTDIKVSIIKKALEEKYTLSEIAAYLNINQSAYQYFFKHINK